MPADAAQTDCLLDKGKGEGKAEERRKREKGVIRDAEVERLLEEGEDDF